MRSVIEMPKPVKRMLRDEKGSTAVIFGAALLPLMFFSGAAIDYSRIMHAKTVLQASADAAVVAAANLNGTNDQKKQLAATVFASNAQSHGVTTTTVPPLSDVLDANNQPTGDKTFTTESRWGTVTTTVSMTASQIVVTPKIDVPMTFMKLMRIAQIGVEGKAVAQGSTKKLEIAMMIDLTGSMGSLDRATTSPQRKIDDLKVASADFLNIVFPNGATTSSSTRVGIVPFADYVNVGSTIAPLVTGLPSSGGSSFLYSKQTNLASTKQGTFTGSYTGAYGTSAASQPAGSQAGAQSPYQQSGTSAPTNASGTTYSNSYCTGGSGTPPSGLYRSASTTPYRKVNLYDNNNNGQGLASNGWNWNNESTDPRYTTSGMYVPIPNSTTFTDYQKSGSTFYGIKIAINGTSVNNGVVSNTGPVPAQIKQVGVGGIASFIEITGYLNGAWVTSTNTTKGTAFIPVPNSMSGVASLTFSGDGMGIPVPAASDPNCTATFDQPNGQLVSCVTEREGTNAYTDAAPSGTANTPDAANWIGSFAHKSLTKSNYSSDGKCWVAGRELPQVIPMTNDKATLTSFFNSATVGGATPGHIGTAWAWYMLSPDWASFWPSTATPAAYGDDQVIKAAVLMTDGEYNIHYASAAASTQALALCTAMRNKGIKVYVIGFGFGPTSAQDNTSEAAARSMLTQCAGSVAGTYFFPYDSATLKQAFTTIGNSLNTLALSQIKVTQ